MINVLPKQIAELISAGEVVERPVSVVKELVENSLDAHAKRITVEVKRGGVSYIRITDDGTGIPREDVPKAFVRFATSKVSTKEDLDRIVTLGFRGEALASVSAVSRVEVYTKTEDEPLGTHYVVEGSEERLNERTGCPDGTTITVRDLFYNVPVRAKFLKRDVVEGNAVSNVVKRLAVSHPDVAFTYVRDGRAEFTTFGDGNQYSSVYSVYGKTFAKDLTPVDHVEGRVSVKGYTVKPLYAKTNRQYQIFFVNGRAVRSDVLSTALEEAYASNIMVGKFPVCVLDLEMPPETLDVNVHPTKAEVRFSDENEVFNAVFFAVKDALMASGLVYDFDLSKTKGARSRATQESVPQQEYVQPNLPNVDLPGGGETVNARHVEENPFIFVGDEPDEPKGSAPKGDDTLERLERFADSPNDFTFSQDVSDAPIVPETEPEPKPVPKPAPAPKASEPTVEPPAVEPSAPYGRLDTSILKGDLPEVKPPEPRKVPKQSIAVVTKPSFYSKRRPEDVHVRLIGEAFKNYVMVEYGDDVVIIDKHAGHERLIYERLKSQNAYTDRQTLLEPIEVLLTDEQSEALEANRNLTVSLGFQLDFSKKPYVLVESVPDVIELEDVEGAIVEVADNVVHGKKNPQAQVIEDVVHSLACKAAIRSNDKTSEQEMVYLAQQILCNDRVRHCPHGRPVMFVMSKSDLERQFKRS